ncbi:hypothetical protein BB560_007131, partial [Smittium megazygosporum]
MNFLNFKRDSNSKKRVRHIIYSSSSDSGSSSSPLLLSQPCVLNTPSFTPAVFTQTQETINPSFVAPVLCTNIKNFISDSSSSFLFPTPSPSFSSLSEEPISLSDETPLPNNMLNLQAGKRKLIFLEDYRPDPELDAFVASSDTPTQSPNIAYSLNPSIVFGNAIATTSTSKITTTKTTTMHQYLTMDLFKPKSTSPLRFSALQFFLTYPKMDNTKDKVVKALIAKNIPILKYVVAKELHADKSSHIHVYIKFKDKINTTNPNVFDILGQHGHYET